MDRDGIASDTIRCRIRGAGKIAIIGIGDELSPADRLGMEAARDIERLHLPGVTVFFAGTVPESITGPLRRYRPGHAIFLDAADTGSRPGSVVLLGQDQVTTNLVTTHVLPLSVVMEYVEQETGSGTTLLGIQPDLSPPEKALDDAALGLLRHNLHILADIIRDRNEADPDQNYPC